MLNDTSLRIAPAQRDKSAPFSCDRRRRLTGVLGASLAMFSMVHSSIRDTHNLLLLILPDTVHGCTRFPIMRRLWRTSWCGTQQSTKDNLYSHKLMPRWLDLPAYVLLAWASATQSRRNAFFFRKRSRCFYNNTGGYRAWIDYVITPKTEISHSWWGNMDFSSSLHRGYRKGKHVNLVYLEF